MRRTARGRARVRDRWAAVAAAHSSHECAGARGAGHDGARGDRRRSRGAWRGRRAFRRCEHHADRLRAYAYQNGGGNITALPGAPQKFIAANDYRRVYDLEHGRMRHQERRNDLFPFANYGGHDFALQNQVLDGAVAYNVNEKGQAVRGGDVRDRRMWMHTNPVVAVRAALNGSAVGSQPPAGERADAGRSEAQGRRRHDDGDSAAVEPAGLGALVRTERQSRRSGVHHALLWLRAVRAACGCRWATPRSSIGATSTC